MPEIQDSEQPACPCCGGKNTEAVSGEGREPAVVSWGILTVSRISHRYVCRDCGHSFCIDEFSF